MREYEIFLKNEKERSYKRISAILLILNLLGILFITYLKDFTRWGPLIIASAAIFAAFASYYFKPKNEKPRLTGAFFLMFAAWISTDYWMIGALNIIFLFLNTLALQIPIVSISESRVLYPSFPKKKIDWEELNNLILKDGLLTIDFKNNKIIQQTIAEDSLMINEQEFNNFCKQQLNK
jgi:hypothetical protein